LKRALPANLDPPAAGYLEDIGAASARMAVLIDDLLAFSRLGRAELHQDHVELQRLLQEVLRELEPDVAGRRITWQIGALPEVTGDAAMLRQVLTNLIDNALKFTRTREPAVIEVGSCPDADRCVVFVRDNGVGFNPAYADKLFGVFQRLHPQAQFKGTGVGLASVRRIIQRHGGSVWADSVEGQGATFYFSLPRA
jgi:signal transduction histidine kinase